MDQYDTVMLANGELLTAGEIFEGFARLAARQASFPLLSREDQIRAAIELLFTSLDLMDLR